MSRKAVLFGLIASIVIVLDQFTKRLIIEKFYLHESVPVFEDFFHVTYIRNVGAAFGILSKSDPTFRVPFFMVVPLIALIVIIWVFRKLPAHSILYSSALGLISGGAIGNLIDRLKYGYVVDFLDFFWNANHFPAFNIADSAICVGVGLLMLDMFKKEKSNAPHTA